MITNQQTQSIQDQFNNLELTAKSAKEIEALLDQAEQNQGEWIELGTEYFDSVFAGEFVIDSGKVFARCESGQWQVSLGEFCADTNRTAIESKKYY